MVDLTQITQPAQQQTAPTGWTPPVFDPATTTPNVVHGPVTDEMREQHEARLALQQQQQDKQQRAAQKQQQKEQQKARAEAWANWQEQCRVRKAYVEELRLAWQRVAAEATVQIARWKEYEASAYLAYKQARDTPAPPNPDAKAE